MIPRTLISLFVFTLHQSFQQNALGADEECTLKCVHGKCELGEADLNEFNSITRLHNIPFLNITHVNNQHCKCPKGYIGVRCEVAFEHCANGEHKCFNGAKCVELPVQGSNGEKKIFTCDCSTASNSTTTFSGHFCEHAATSFCEFGVAVSKHAFCANGGECEESISQGQAHVGCKCKPGWEGDHCQFTEGQLSKFISTATASDTASDSTKAHPGAIALFVLVLALMAGVVVAIVLNVRRNRSQQRAAATDVATADELQLEVDGSSTLPQTPRSEASTPEFGTQQDSKDEDDDHQDEDEEGQII